jgi:inosine/xanthosine triphosphatase
MKIGIGSTNQVKINAVKEVIALYDMFNGAEIVPVKTSSGVADQPLSLEETIQGAKNRAKAAYEENDFGIGLESGLIEVPHTKTGMMDTCVCVIYDGREYHIGLSAAFEYPIKVTETVRAGTRDISQAFHEHKLTENPNIGTAEGAIGILTKGRLNRTDYTKQALTMALIHLENPELYTK